jgi:hypothetical protein
MIHGRGTHLYIRCVYSSEPIKRSRFIVTRSEQAEKTENAAISGILFIHSRT